MHLKFKRLPHFNNLPIPKHQTAGASGIDLHAAITADLTLRPMERVLIPTGLAFELPVGCEAHVRPRSSVSKNGLLVYFGTCDEDYTGEYFITIQNLSGQDYIIRPGDRLAQMIVTEYVHLDLQEVSELKKTARADKGYGSTGR